MAPGLGRSAHNLPRRPADTEGVDTSLWMSRDLLTAPPDLPLAEAARRMAERRVRHLLVVADDAPQHLLGILSSHDVYLAAEAGIHPHSPCAVDRPSRRVGEVMTHQPSTIPSSTPLAEAARILRDRKFGALPVVDRGELVGILTEHDLLRAFLSLSGADQPGYEVTAVVRDGADVLSTMLGIAAQRGLQMTSANVFDHAGKRHALLHFVGARDDAFVEALWRCGHTILRVRPTEGQHREAQPAGAAR